MVSLMVLRFLDFAFVINDKIIVFHGKDDVAVYNISFLKDP